MTRVLHSVARPVEPQSRLESDAQTPLTAEKLEGILRSALIEAEELRTFSGTRISGLNRIGLAYRLYAIRRRRARHFDEQLFSEPAWDVLLDLYIAHHEGRSISVSSACIAAATPPTTALRWLQHLEECGLILREPDRTDGRRAFLRLSDEALRRMDQLLRDSLDILGSGPSGARRPDSCQLPPAGAQAGRAELDS